MNIIEQVAFDMERLRMNLERAEALIAELEAELRSLYEERRRAVLDRMVEIADESGMYDLPPMNEADDIVEELRDWGDIVNGSKGSAEVVFISGDFLHEAASEIERLRAEIKVLHMALDSNHNEEVGYPE